jgi:hypothetical protein
VSNIACPGKFGRIIRIVFFTLGALLFGVLLFAYFYAKIVPVKRTLAAEDIGDYICVDARAIAVGSRMHYRGRVFVITKVVMQDAREWVDLNRSFFLQNQGPRIEDNKAIRVEVSPPIVRESTFSYAYYGVSVD